MLRRLMGLVLIISVLMPVMLAVAGFFIYRWLSSGWRMLQGLPAG